GGGGWARRGGGGGRPPPRGGGPGGGGRWAPAAKIVVGVTAAGTAAPGANGAAHCTAPPASSTRTRPAADTATSRPPATGVTTGVSAAPPGRGRRSVHTGAPHGSPGTKIRMPDGCTS